jgi:hypothetical protein
MSDVNEQRLSSMLSKCSFLLENTINNVGYEVLTAVVVKSSIVWDIT